MTRLISLADVKPLLPIRQGNASYDDRITQIIDAVSALIETECRQQFTQSERTELHTTRASTTRTLNLYGDSWGDISGLGAVNVGAEEQVIPLRASPIDAQAAVTVWYDPTRQFTDDTIIDPSYYMVDTELSRILLQYPTRYVRSGLRVKYTAGYVPGDDGSLSASAPADLKQAAILATIHMWNRTNPEAVGTDSEGEGKDRVKVNSYGLPRESLPYLTNYRRVLTGTG